MIQRIQSIYLLLVTILMGVTMISPLMNLSNGETPYDFYCLAIKSIGDSFPTWGVAFLAGLSSLIALINIFLYKTRKVQMKVGTLTSLLILFFYVTVFVYFNSYTNRLGLTFEGIQYGLILPVVALLFNILAILRI